MYTSKDKVRCVLAVEHWRIEGDVHLLEGSRLTDSMNSKAKDFIAVTDAVVFDAASGRELFRPPYMAVNRTLIAVVFPLT
ncbi:MAG: hypothetical protein CVT67_09410 [Actinobacteria bacterium HGW-Actinobacteria-7]|nr:MAG: hypothetical protein CVT67_09410 [Actinobacteria bacterium HGW-Actinobacteria-7]